MKVYIGPYSEDLIPIYRLELAYERMRARQLGIHHWEFDESRYQWYDRIADKIFDRLRKLAEPLNQWSNNLPRKIKVRIDDYDTWSAENTLAQVILPTLVQLKKHMQGSPLIDINDVPEHLRPTEEPDENNGYIDNTHHDRWNWVLDEMIWAFQQHAMGSDKWEDQFVHNIDQFEIKWIKIEEGEFAGHTEMKTNYQKDPSKPPYFRDQKGIDKHHERMANGRRLFAKYYEGLWD